MVTGTNRKVWFAKVRQCLIVPQHLAAVEQGQTVTPLRLLAWW